MRARNLFAWRSTKAVMGKPAANGAVAEADGARKERGGSRRFR